MKGRRLMLLACLVVPAVAYGLFGYWYDDRSNFTLYIMIYVVLFASYLAAIRLAATGEVTGVALAAMGFRAILIFSVPVLSDDYYRFLWDGHLLSGGLNPYTVLPQDLAGSADPYRSELLNGMNSPAWFTTYPPACQLLFFLSCRMFPGNIFWQLVALRLFLLVAEAGSALLIFRLLRKLSLPMRNGLLYLLNPLVITELTGNLHFEAAMIFFLLLAVYLLIGSRPVLSAAALAAAVSVKVLPLIFLPLLWRRLGLRRGGIYSGMVLFFSALTLLPFLDEDMLRGAASGLSLYFRHFEFNGSAYQLLKGLGYLVAGHNAIAVNGPLLAVAAFVVICVMARRHRSTGGQAGLLRSMLYAVTAYYLLALVVHPWYITTILALSSFTAYRFPVVWTALIPLTYLTYTSAPYLENLWVIAAEYTILAAFMAREAGKHRKRELTGSG